MIKIRTPLFAEKKQWLPLWAEYCAGYHAANVFRKMTNLTWRRFHDPDEPMHVLCAYQGKEMIGFAAFVFHRSTWAKGDYCYLEDLFVAKKSRRQGIARKLIKLVRIQAKKAKAEHFYWATLQKNRAARTLYDKIAERTAFIQYRMKL